MYVEVGSACWIAHGAGERDLKCAACCKCHSVPFSMLADGWALGVGCREKNMKVSVLVM